MSRVAIITLFALSVYQGQHIFCSVFPIVQLLFEDGNYKRASVWLPYPTKNREGNPRKISSVDGTSSILAKMVCASLVTRVACSYDNSVDIVISTMLSSFGYTYLYGS